MTPPRFTLKVVCQRVGLSPHIVRSCIREGLVEPRSSRGRLLFDEAAIERLARIRRLRSDLGVNIPGIDIILRLCERIEDLETRFARMRGEVQAQVEARVHPYRRECEQHPAPTSILRGEIVRVEVIEDEST